MYNRIECPICGNEVVVKLVKEPQKCKWCKRFFKVNSVKHKGKQILSLECVDFPESVEQQGKPVMPSPNCRGSKKV